MMSAPPEGIGEGDYEAIEAAVMETARGRWFLTEFARRSRIDETQQMLAAITQLEQAVLEQKALPADPSIRLLVQRLKDVAGHLDSLAAELRVEGQDEGLCARLEAQARALLGLLRLNAPLSGPSVKRAAIAAAQASSTAEPPQPSLQPDAPARGGAVSAPTLEGAGQDPRLAALARIDNLSLSEKFALFV